MSRISERDLLLPALYIISENEGIKTTRIKEILIGVFKPSGEDNQRLAGRSDTKFTQIVRNLLGSHYDTNGMRDHTEKDASGGFRITPQGQSLVDLNREYLNYLFENPFSYEDAQTLTAKITGSQTGTRKLYIYTEDEEVKEGQSSVALVNVKARSRKLREAALAHYTQNGKIACHVCGFDFQEYYGELGSGYIQMHHERPICQYSDEGFEEYLGDAVENMKPVCANCHCMIHRSKGAPITIEELKKAIENAQTSRN